MKDVLVCRDPAKSVSSIWSDYAATRSPELRNQLLVHYLPLVKFAALRVAGRLAGQADVDDLYQSGAIGLRDAIASFDPNRGVKFETYCTLRIRGAMFDGLKPMDPLPREVRRAVHKVHDAQRQLRVETGREPLPEELAEATGNDRQSCIRFLRASRDTTPVSLFEINGEGEDCRPVDQLVDDKSPAPIDAAQREDLKKVLQREFTRGERLVLTLYYYEQMTMQEIGETLGVTATRVCQIHGELLKRLREKLGSRMEAEALLTMK